MCVKYVQEHLHSKTNGVRRSDVLPNPPPHKDHAVSRPRTRMRTPAHPLNAPLRAPPQPTHSDPPPPLPTENLATVCCSAGWPIGGPAPPSQITNQASTVFSHFSNHKPTWWAISASPSVNKATAAYLQQTAMISRGGARTRGAEDRTGKTEQAHRTNAPQLVSFSFGNFNPRPPAASPPPPACRSIRRRIWRRKLSDGCWSASKEAVQSLPIRRWCMLNDVAQQAHGRFDRSGFSAWKMGACLGDKSVLAFAVVLSSTPSSRGPANLTERTYCSADAPPAYT